MPLYLFQVKILQTKVEVLGDNQNDSQDRIVRVKQDNSVLQAKYEYCALG